MRCRLFLVQFMTPLSLLAFAVMPMLSLPSKPQQTTLAALRHDYRPLLIFSRSADQRVQEQIQMVGERVQEIEGRQVLVVPVLLRREKDDSTWSSGLPKRDIIELEPADCVAARRRFHIGDDDFAVVLLGKDGGEKLHAASPVTIERLIRLIDAMPMRQKEVRDGHPG
jgi:hypothetical protein